MKDPKQVATIYLRGGWRFEGKCPKHERGGTKHVTKSLGRRRVREGIRTEVYMKVALVSEAHKECRSKGTHHHVNVGCFTGTLPSGPPTEPTKPPAVQLTSSERLLPTRRSADSRKAPT
jgi:hypothetical protein